MEYKYIEILGIYPGMYASKFSVREDTWETYHEEYMNERAAGCCFMPCRDGEGDPLFVDMTKLLAFYVLKKDPVKKAKKKKAVSEK